MQPSQSWREYPAIVVAETLRQVFMQAPVGSCELSALNLKSLASDLHFEAIRAFVRILAAELGFDSDSPTLLHAQSAVELCAATDVPGLLRIYVLGFTQRDFVENAEGCCECAVGVFTDEIALAAFKRLLRRDALVEHEILRAYTLAAFIISLRTTAVGGGPWPSCASSDVLDRISGSCRIVPGLNANTHLEFGRDLLLKSTPHGLLTIIAHEIGHIYSDHVKRGCCRHADNKPADELFVELSRSLPRLLDNALRLKGAPFAAHDKRSFKTSSGMEILCSYAETARASCVHLSLTQDRGPIELRQAAQWAYAMLLVLEIDPTLAAAAYSSRGTFHFGFSGQGPPISRLSQRVLTLTLENLAPDLERNSRFWLDALVKSDRMGDNQADVEAALGLIDGPFYGIVPIKLANESWGIIDRIRDGSILQGASVDSLNELLVVAIRCADAAAVRALLDAGAAPRARLLDLGLCHCVVGGRKRMKYFGPCAADVFEILSSLHSAGLDLNEALDDKGHTLLTEAACRSLDLVRFLTAHSADVNRAGANGETPLAIASKFADFEVVRQLLEAGGCVQARDDRGDTPLHAVAERGDERLFRLLVENGADPNAANDHGRTPLMGLSPPHT